MSTIQNPDVSGLRIPTVVWYSNYQKKVGFQMVQYSYANWIPDSRSIWVLDTILFSYVLVGYSKSQSSTYNKAHDPNIWILEIQTFRGPDLKWSVFQRVGVLTIWKPDHSKSRYILSKFQMFLDKMGGSLSWFQMVKLQDFRSHWKFVLLKNLNFFGPFEIQTCLDFRSPLGHQLGILEILNMY